MSRPLTLDASAHGGPGQVPGNQVPGNKVIAERL
ncbi:hypothetical protein CA85_38890 [Allorhodopirellula solitaria]|uniref:Uncharacterized protein n=1 Tax=Allorhodopirellula solitaria TaxID=2527987 RepID=A0A5C5XA49_9BACT|nr:hypothetical protein CA85_38890 [Allorhodopirellula solitaria]